MNRLPGIDRIALDFIPPAKEGPPMPTGKSKARSKAPNSSTGNTREKPKVHRARKTAAERNHADNLIVVGIGASAGGLEAFKHVLPGLPTDANMAFVIVQHLDPKHRSMMASLLDRHTTMDVLEIADGQKVEANHVYITPPGRDVKISGNVLHLSTPSAAIGPKPSIDYFLTSLAESKADRAVGIILSGTGSDGAHGIRAIKAGGGITIVQNEETARYNGMPHSAIETGHVDLVVDPGNIGNELQVAIKYPHLIPQTPPEAEAPKDIDRILHMIAERTGTNLAEYKLATINRRVGRRMALHKIRSLSDYLHYIEQFPKELDLLLKDILISVTGFFRDPEAFQALKRALPNIIKNKEKGDGLRIWVPGCATGEEAYSIAMLLYEQLGSKANQYNIQIFGTDLDQDAIMQARKGIYPMATVVDMDKEIVAKYFSQADNTVQVIKSIREMIVFAKQDLTRDPPFSHLDLISCRNLLIYFNSNLQKKIVPMFHYILNGEGLLFLGKSESIGQFSDLFVPMVKKWKIFQRRDTMRTPLVDFAVGKRLRYLGKGTQTMAPRPKEVPIKQVFAESVINAMGNCAVMIDERQEIVFVQGDVAPYLTLAQGEIGLSVLNMARPEIRLDLRAIIHKATRENCFVRSNKINFHFNGRHHQLILHAGPATGPNESVTLTLVMFEEIAPLAESEQDKPDHKPSGDPRMLELEQELAATREHLQTTVEELETTNEELQSLNEELQSSNEELQSSNEELETSNEELQSTNEELTTVNEELQVKSGELAEANTDLENILNRSGMAMIIVNNQLKVTRFTPTVGRFFQLTSSDCGHVITTIPCNVDFPDLRRTLLTVIGNGETVEQEFSLETGRYLIRITPYLGEFALPVGAMLTFVDLSLVQRTERALEESNATLQAVLDNVVDSIIVADEKGTIEAINASAERIFGYSEEEAVGRNVTLLQPEPYRSKHDQYIKNYLRTGEAKIIGISREVSGRHKNGGTFPIHLTVTEIKVYGQRKFVGIIQDLTAREPGPSTAVAT
jgi:two-component system, chemotaxis family, CheB/CheR fusion protein